MLTENRFHTGTPTGTLTLNYAEGGPANGPALLMLPGFTRNWQCFLPVVPAFVDDWHLYIPDYRGHGRSDRAPSYRAADYLADLTAFLRHVVERPAVIMGHALGGTLALALAAADPEAVRALVVCEAVPQLDVLADRLRTPQARSEAATRRALAGQPLHAVTPVLEAAPPQEAEAIGLLDPAVLDDHVTGHLDAFLEGISPSDLSQITAPVLLVQANPALGGLLSDEDVDRALDVLPDAVHVQVTHAGHDLGFASGELRPLLDAITDFLRDV